MNRCGTFKGRGPGREHEGKDMLNNIGLPGILLIAVVVLVLFGRGKISGLMGEVGKGITSFKRGIKEGEESAAEEAAELAKDVTPEQKKTRYNPCLIWVGPSCTGHWDRGAYRSGSQRFASTIQKGRAICWAAQRYGARIQQCDE